MNVDIILPIYKPNEKFLYEAIDSIIKQTYENWKLIIIDDASKDKSLDKIREKYGTHNSKIQYIRLEKNMRAAGARNYAISKNNGELIAFIDQDDKWKQNKLEEYIKYFNDHDEVKLIHSNIDAIDNNGNMMNGYFDKENGIRKTIPYLKMSNNEMVNHLFNYYSVRLGTLCINRNAFIKSGAFDDSLFGGEDEEFIVRFAYKFRIGFINDKLTYRREHNENTSKIMKMVRSFGKYRALKKMHKRYKIFSYKKISNYEKYLARNAFYNKKLILCIYYLMRSNISRILNYLNKIKK